MKIIYPPRFSREYKKLPDKAKNLIEKSEKIFIKNPFDKSLKTHKLSGKLKGLWAFSKEKGIIYLHSVGTHRIYQ